jgi:hypothetical protein
MTTITLPPEIEGPLTEQALLRGTTPELLALDILRTQFQSVGALDTHPLDAGAGKSRSLADWLSPFIGTLTSSDHVAGEAALSVDSGRKFTAVLKARHSADR